LLAGRTYRRPRVLRPSKALPGRLRPTDPVIDPATYTCTFTYYRDLDLTFTVANGDKLVLVSSFSSTTAPTSTPTNGGAVTGARTVDLRPVPPLQRLWYLRTFGTINVT
jgi:hypothetical protein